jgi:hypothetical protein
MTSPDGKLSYAIPISGYSCRLETDVIVLLVRQRKNSPKSTYRHHA